MRIERIYKSNPLVFSKKKTQQAIYIYIYHKPTHQQKKNIKGKADRKKNWKKTTRKEGEERR